MGRRHVHHRMHKIHLVQPILDHQNTEYEISFFCFLLLVSFDVCVAEKKKKNSRIKAKTKNIRTGYTKQYKHTYFPRIQGGRNKNKQKKKYRQSEHTHTHTHTQSHTHISAFA